MQKENYSGKIIENELLQRMTDLEDNATLANEKRHPLGVFFIGWNRIGKDSNLTLRSNSRWSLLSFLPASLKQRAKRRKGRSVKQNRPVDDSVATGSSRP